MSWSTFIEENGDCGSCGVFDTDKRRKKGEMKDNCDEKKDPKKTFFFFKNYIFLENFYIFEKLLKKIKILRIFFHGYLLRITFTVSFFTVTFHGWLSRLPSTDDFHDYLLRMTFLRITFTVTFCTVTFHGWLSRLLFVRLLFYESLFTVTFPRLVFTDDFHDYLLRMTFLRITFHG